MKTKTHQSSNSHPLIVSGIVPSLSMKAGLGPPRTECAAGALFTWADRLWCVTYVSSGRKSGMGTGLFEIDENLHMVKRPESLVGTYTNRMEHFPSNQLILGPYVIDADRNVRTIEPLTDIRLCSTIYHLEDPENRVYMLGMEGEFYEMDVHTLEVTELADLTKELEIPKGHWPHFKAGYSAFGRVVVASNTYHYPDFEGTECAGRLGEWDGREWNILERAPYYEVTGVGDFSGSIFATGWDKASALLNVFTQRNNTWTRYRLPKASHTFDHGWSTEWPRIRQTEHERFLMDCHGMFYELSPWVYDNRIWGVKPISTHLWVLGDFCIYRGMLVMGPDNASAMNRHNPLTGDPQSALWFGKTDDLWQFGKPSGWGGPWRETGVTAGEPSDPFLMTGFDSKTVHCTQKSDTAVQFTLEVDFLGNGRWYTYDTFEIPAGGYVHHEFPQGFSAHWVRMTADKECTATVYFTYT